MSGGWADSDRKSRLPANWASEIVPAVKKRAGNRCEKLLPSGRRCPRRGTDVDHKDADDDHRLFKLQLLCPHHHGKKSASEGNRARWAKRKSAKRPAEGHPNRLT